jgi:hypothetical protein
MTFRWPGEYFISHSYKDSDIVESLLKKLPLWMKPYVFPPIKVKPDQMVSNSLMNAIRRCSGLIYLEEGKSASSFWVAMERDYAFRLGKRVYSFNSINEKLTREKRDPLDLRVFHAYSRTILQNVSHIADLMKERYFDTFINIPTISTAYEDVVKEHMMSVKAIGGYVLIYWSKDVEHSPVIPAELDLAMREYPDRVLLVQLDDTPLPIWITDQISKENTINIMEDNKSSQLHKIDDLIVRLYWLIYRNVQKDM